jgi:hypothetical protein
MVREHQGDYPWYLSVASRCEAGEVKDANLGDAGLSRKNRPLPPEPLSLIRHSAVRREAAL